MDDALQRMRLLEYESGYCAPRDIVPFHRFQFAIAGSNARCVPKVKKRSRAHHGVHDVMI